MIVVNESMGETIEEINKKFEWSLQKKLLFVLGILVVMRLLKWPNIYIRNPLGEKYPSDSKFNKKELKMGIKVEMEHTTDKNIAKSIAKDHLMEDKHYYSKLKTLNL